MKYLHELDDAKQISFYDNLMERLPYKTHGGNEKGSMPNFIPKGEALHGYKFIRYNTKKTASTLIFDFDETMGNAEHWFKLLFNRTGIKFSWVTETDNGIQAGIFLDKRVFVQNGHKNKMRLAKLKKRISEILSMCFIDTQGSNRLLGIWRNPILHPTVISSASYSMEQLMQHFKLSMSMEELQPKRNTLRLAPTASKMNLSPTSSIQLCVDDGFHVGNRNNYMYSYGFKIVFENRSKLSSIETIMQEENQSHSNPMTASEISAIARSVKKASETMYVPTRKDEEKPQAKHYDYMYKNNIHGKYNRYSFGAYTTAEGKRQKTAHSLLSHLVSLFEKGINNPTNRKVVEGINIKLRQYQNIKKKYTVAGIFSEWIFGMLGNSHSIGIKANCMGMGEDGFKGINKLIEKIITAEGEVFFITRDRFNWRYPITSTEPPLKAVA